MKIEKVTLRANVELSRANDGLFYLVVRDAASSINVVEVTLTAEQFADLLSNRVTGAVVPMLLAKTDKFGLRRERRKDVRRVALERGAELASLQLAAGQLQVENPDWEVDVPTEWNRHLSKFVEEDDAGRWYACLFSLGRWVP